MSAIRRDFIQQLALLAAGIAARPDQVATFERYYDANTPVGGNDFIAIDEISLSGLALSMSTPVKVEFWQEDICILPAAFNAFGGIYFWRANPDGKMIALRRQVIWKTRLMAEATEMLPNRSVENIFLGHIKYIRGSDMTRWTQIINVARGVIG